MQNIQRYQEHLETSFLHLWLNHLDQSNFLNPSTRWLVQLVLQEYLVYNLLSKNAYRFFFKFIDLQFWTDWFLW